MIVSTDPNHIWHDARALATAFKSQSTTSAQ